MNKAVIAVSVIALILAAAITAIMFITRGKAGLLDKRKYQQDWLKIENSLSSKNLNTYRLAIFDADSLLDRALKELGVPGNTMGERLKHSNSKFANINQVWTAHKLRNHLAHNADARVNEIVLRRAIAIFKRSLKELGAI